MGRRRRAGAAPPGCAALAPALEDVSRDGRARCIARGRATAATTALRELGDALRRGRRRTSCASTRRLIEAAPALLDADAARGAARSRRATSSAVAEPSWRRCERPTVGRARRRASGSRSARRRSPPPASTRPAAAAAYPSSVLMGAIPARVAGVGAARRRLAARRRRAARPTRCSPPARSRASTRSTRSAARRRSPRSPSAPRSIAAGRRDRRARQPLRDRGQAAARRARRDRRASPGRASSSWSPTAPPTRS